MAGDGPAGGVSGASTFVAKVSARGRDMGGLMRYLYGPGRANEHTDQHMIAGTLDVRRAFAGPLSAQEATQLGRVLESSWREQMAEANALAGVGAGGVPSSTLQHAPDTPGDVPGDVSGGVPGGVPESVKEHVYHLVVSLPAGRDWTDDQFATVATEYMRRLGLSQGEDDELGCRWAAVRHGRSAGGNEHIHIAVNLVRQDGTRARLPQYDFPRVQEIRRELETELDFVTPLHDPGQEVARGMPGYSMGEHQQALAAGQVAPDRVLLAQHLRAAYAASSTEAEWIERAIAVPGVSVQVTRWQAGGRDVATGYSARIDEGRWFPASQIAPDLTLGKMRAAWEAHETPETRAVAAAMWRDEYLPPAPTNPATATADLDAAEAHLRQWATTVQAADIHDDHTWRQVDRDLAGLTTSLTTSLRGPGTPTSDATLRDVIRAGQIATHRALPTRTTPTVLPRVSTGPTPVQLAARHIQLAARAGSLDSHPGWIAVLQQLARTARAAEAARAARGELAAARQLATLTTHLITAHHRLHDTYGGGDLATLREAWTTRDITTVRGRRTPAPAPQPRADTAPTRRATPQHPHLPDGPTRRR